MPSVDSRRVGSLETALDILEALVDAPDGLGVTRLSEAIDADKSNVHRLLGVLQRRGYVAQDVASKRYRITVQLVSLAGAILRELDLRPIASVAMRQLLDETGEAVHLALLTKRGAVYIAQERPPNRVSVETEIGGQPPLHCTAAGKALIAFVSEDRLAELVKEPLDRYTMRTHKSLDSLRAELSEIRDQGFAVDDEEYGAGVRCVAAPIFDLHGEVVACLGLSGPAARIDLVRIGELADGVLRAADGATAELGGHLPERAAHASGNPHG